MYNLQLMKLQYEILNSPLSLLAEENNIPEDILAIDARTWVRWWPKDAFLDLTGIPVTDRDQAIEQYESQIRQRLQIFSLAKELLLTQKYAKFEFSLVEAAQATLGQIEILDVGPQALNLLANTYRTLKEQSISKALQAISLSQDESGIPTVIIKDLSS